jgi:hypothetical protein
VSPRDIQITFFNELASILFYPIKLLRKIVHWSINVVVPEQFVGMLLRGKEICCQQARTKNNSIRVQKPFSSFFFQPKKKHLK